MTSYAATAHRPGDGPMPTPARTMRIAFFTDSYAPTHDGVARLTAALAAELRRRGHAVTIHTVRLPRQPHHEVTPEGIEVVRHRSVAAPSYPQYRIALCPYGPAIRSDFGGHFDIVHVHTPGFVGLGGWLAARRWGLPVVGTYHTHLAGMLENAAQGRLGAAFFRAWSRFAIDLCWASDLATAPTRKAVAHLGGGARHGRPLRVPRVVPNGVDTSRFHPAISAPDWRVRLRADGGPLVTFLGRLTRDKGASRFLDALEGWPSQLPLFGVIAGEGPLAEEIRRRLLRSERYPAPVRFVGPVAEEEKPSLLAQSRVFVLPSRSDTSSIALLEAMASGAACVVTREGGPGEIAALSRACVTVDPMDIEGIREGIRGLLLDPPFARSLSERARTWVLSHGSIAKTAQEYAEAYRELLDSPALARGAAPPPGTARGDADRTPASAGGL